MFSFFLQRRLLAFLLPLAFVLTAYLYLYPIVHGCAFPSPNSSRVRDSLDTASQHAGVSSSADARVIPFRLLALGDPQLEGDSAVAKSKAPLFNFLKQLRADQSEPQSFSESLSALPARGLLFVLDDVPSTLRGWRKQFDLFGNDYYLAHIYRTVRWWTRPTHIAVLGDLLGSEWVSDEEFERRSSRFWQIVFRGGHKVEHFAESEVRSEPLNSKEDNWSRNIISIVGNHDVGYAGDMTPSKVERFERDFGDVNWNIRFQLLEDPANNNESTPDIDDSPELRLVVLNSMNLDTPAFDSRLQGETYDFLNDVVRTSRDVQDRRVATVLLTHVPLYKEEGVCVDAPFVTYNEEIYGSGISEQNHLSYHSTQAVLESLYGMSPDPNAYGGGIGRKGIILTGHDHEGCDVYHHVSADTAGKETDKWWKAIRWGDAKSVASATDRPGIREVTVRSMMGDFGGNAGLLSGWYDYDTTTWHFEYSTCALGTQHVWWTVHIIDLIVTLVVIFQVANWFQGKGISTSDAAQQGARKKTTSATAPRDGTTTPHSSSSSAVPGKGTARKRH